MLTGIYYTINTSSSARGRACVTAHCNTLFHVALCPPFVMAISHWIPPQPSIKAVQTFWGKCFKSILCIISIGTNLFPAILSEEVDPEGWEISLLHFPVRPVQLQPSRGSLERLSSHKFIEVLRTFFPPAIGQVLEHILGRAKTAPDVINTLISHIQDFGAFWNAETCKRLFQDSLHFWGTSAKWEVAQLQDLEIIWMWDKDNHPGSSPLEALKWFKSQCQFLIQRAAQRNSVSWTELQFTDFRKGVFSCLKVQDPWSFF